MEWLPITLGKNFSGQVLKAKKVYRSGEFEARTELPLLLIGSWTQ